MPDANEIDLDALNAFLLSDRAPENSMGLSDLDGFLTGIVAGPELVMPAEWLPVIWSGEEPEFADMNEARSVLGAVMGRYNEIIALLDSEPARVDPLFAEGPEGKVIVTDWAAGFLNAMKLRAKAWGPLLQHKKARLLIIPLLVLGADDDDHLLFGQGPLPADEVKILHAGGARMIPLCIVGIRAFWQEHRWQSTLRMKRNRQRPGARRRRG
jgi:uncharacterized protein